MSHTSQPSPSRVRPTLNVTTTPPHDDGPDLMITATVPGRDGDVRASLSQWAGESTVYVEAEIEGHPLGVIAPALDDLGVLEGFAHALVAVAQEARRRGILPETDSRVAPHSA